MKLLSIAVLFSCALLMACHRPTDGTTAADSDRVVSLIMSDIGFNSEIVPILRAEVKKQGFELKWVVVNDIIQPNKLVDDGSADANSFQHEPYFEQFVNDHGLKHVTRGFYTIFTPSGIYSRKYKSLDQVPDGATFGIPVDPANNGRALFMLQEKGLLKLKPGVSVVHAGLRDIVENPHHFKFREVDQLMLMRTIDDVDAGFLFSLYAIKSGFDPIKDALAIEHQEGTPFYGIVAINDRVVGTPKIKALQKAYASEALKAFYRSKYGDAIVFLDQRNS